MGPTEHVGTAPSEGGRATAAPPDGTGTRAGRLLENAGWQLLAAVNSVVIVVAVVRGLARGYEPVSDNALIEIRGRDVLTANHPLLGTASSASVSSGIELNHPGPLLFDIVALPVRVLGEAAGLALAIAAVQVAVVWLIGWVVARSGGWAAATVTQTITAILLWTLGSELLYDPWQPNFLVLPFFLLMCTTWSIVGGRIAYLPLAAGVGSLIMQTHMTYLLFVPALILFAIVVAVRECWPERRRELRRPAFTSVAVVLILWAQPFWEQLFGVGEGNISRIVRAGLGGGSGGAESATPGGALVVRMLGSVLALPPWWGRPGFDDSIPGSTWETTPSGRSLSAPGLPTVGAASVALVVVVGMVTTVWVVAAKRRDRFVLAGLETLAVGFVVAVITVWITPIDVLGLSPHKVRWLWVIGAFGTAVLVTAAVTWTAPRARLVAVGSVATVGLVAAAAALPTHRNQSGPVQFAVTYPSVDDIRDQLDSFLEERSLGPVVFDADGIGFAEPYTAPVIAELLAHDVDLVVEDPLLQRQFGPNRRATAGTDDRSVVFVRVGQDAVEQPAGSTRIAFHDGERTPYSVNDVTDRAVAVFVAPPPADPAG